MPHPINRMRPVHPSEVLREEYLAPLGLSVNALAIALAVPASSESYHYENTSYTGALTGKSFNGIRFSNYAYDANGRAIKTEHLNDSTAIERYSFVYSTPGTDVLEVTETNPLGKQAVYRFNQGELESVTGLPSVSCPASLYTRTKDANGYTDNVTDFNDHVTDLDFDANGHPLREVHGVGSASAKTVNYSWDLANEQLLSRRVEGDLETSYSYDSQGRILTETLKNLSVNGVANQARTTTISYTLQSDGLIATKTVDGSLSGTGDVVTYSYSTTGDLLTIKNALGTLLTYSSYNALGLPARLTDIYGVIFDYSYDARGRLLSTKRTVNGVSVTNSVSYDNRGRLISQANADGTSRTFGYDNADRLTTITRPETVFSWDMSNVGMTSMFTHTDYRYNADSRPVESSILRYASNDSTFNMAGLVKSFIDYDELGRAKAQRGNNGQNIRTGYDESGYVTSTTDSLGRVTTPAYDSLNRIITRTDAKKGVTRFSYDAGDRITSVTDPRGLVTQYSYDGFDQLWRLESPDTGVTTFAYDATGLRTSMTQANATVISYGYDTLGRVVRQSASTGGVAREYSYDGCWSGLGRLCGVTDASGWTQYGYTPTGQLWVQRSSVQGSDDYVWFAYDNLDRLATVQYPDGKTANYSYADGALRSVTTTPNGTTQTVMGNMLYQPFGPLYSASYGNGLTYERSFDNDGRLIRKKNYDWLTSVYSYYPASAGTDFSYTWDANDQITALTNNSDSTQNIGYGYDELGRLSTGKMGSDNTLLSFDSAGNRISLANNGVTLWVNQYSTTSQRLLSLVTSGVTTQVWTYDANGNSTGFTGSDGIAVGLHYDAFGRIDSSSRNGQTTSYSVNALGQRVRKAGPNGTTRYIVAPDGSLLAEYKDGTGWTDYIRANGETVGLIRSNTLTYIHNDHLGRPELATNSAKAKVWSATNYPFDRSVTFDQLGGLNLGLPGQYYDQETNTWNNGFRTYDSIGRYLQSDPIGLAGGVNTYAYVGGNPLRYVDPLGLEWQLSLGLGGTLGALFGPFGGGGVNVGFTSSGNAFIQFEGHVEVGFGIYAGGGVQGGVSYSKCASSEGWSQDTKAIVEGNMGAGASVGGSATFDKQGVGGSAGIGRYGIGMGIMGAAGASHTWTYTTPTIQSLWK